MSSATKEAAPATLGVRHALLVFAAPRSLFARVADTGSYGWALLTLLLLILLIGYAEVQTGLIDREVDVQTAQKLADLERNQGTLIDRVEFRDRMETIQKEGTFLKMMTRLGVIVATPAFFLASFLLIASYFYAIVALTGRKPEYHTLMSICVFAGFIELVGLGLKLVMMLYYRTTQVDTSLAVLAGKDAPKFLTALDPFHLWFWTLVGIGLVVTHQLSKKVAIASCAMLALGSIGVRIAIAYSSAA